DTFIDMVIPVYVIFQIDCLLCGLNGLKEFSVGFHPVREDLDGTGSKATDRQRLQSPSDNKSGVTRCWRQRYRVIVRRNELVPPHLHRIRYEQVTNESDNR